MSRTFQSSITRSAYSARPANQRDYMVRMQEFFDHHLRGRAAPAWLKEGVPHLKLDDHLKERAKEKGD